MVRRLVGTAALITTVLCVGLMVNTFFEGGTSFMLKRDVIGEFWAPPGAKLEVLQDGEIGELPGQQRQVEYRTSRETRFIRRILFVVIAVLALIQSVLLLFTPKSKNFPAISPSGGADSV